MSQILPTQLLRELNLKGYKPLIGIEIAGLSKYFSPFKTFSSDLQTYVGEIFGAPQISIDVDRMGGFVKAGGMTMSILNQELFSNIFASGVNPENEEIIVKLFCDDGTAILNAESIQLFKGVISDFPTIDYNVVDFNVERYDIIKEAIIGVLISESDAAANFTLPEESLGKVKPIIYGDHLFYLHNLNPALVQTTYENNMVKLISLGGNEYLISGHQLDEIDAIWGFDTDIKRFVKLTAFTTKQNTANGAIILMSSLTKIIYLENDLIEINGSTSGSFSIVISPNDYTATDLATEIENKITTAVGSNEIDVEYNVALDKYRFHEVGNGETWTFKWATGGGKARSIGRVLGFDVSADDSMGASGTITADYQLWEVLIQKYYDFWFGNGTTTPIVQTWQNAARAVNRDFSDYALAQILQADPVGEERIEDVNFDTYDNDRITDSDISQIAYFARTSFAANDITRFNFKIAEIEVRAKANDPIYLVADTFITTKAQIAASIRIKNKKTFTASTDGVAKVYQVYKRIKYTPSQTLDLYASVKGRKYGTWINSRTQTENHVNNGGSTNLIENAAGVIESITRDEIGLENAEIDLAQFNIASNDLPTSKLSFAIINQIKATRLIGDIAKTVKSAIFYDFDNKLNMKVFVSGDPFAASEDSVANNQDIFEFDPQSTFKIVTGENDKIDLNGSTSGLFAITLAAGDYTGSTLSDELENKLDSAIGANELNSSYVNNKIKFDEIGNGETWTFKWADGANKVRSIGRFLGFDISSNDSLGALGTLIADYPLYVNSFVEHPIIENSFKLRKTYDDIVTNLTVNYFPNHIGKFQRNRTSIDNTYHAETLKGVFEHPFTRDQITADIYKDFLVKSDGTGRLSKRYYEMEFKTWLNGVIAEPFDIINNRHPVLTGIFGSGEDILKWGITGILIDLDSMEVRITSTQLTTP